MTTSGVITSSLTVREVINTAAELIQRLPQGGTLSAANADLGIKHLNWMLKTWQASGACDGWRLSDVTITWPAATQSATLNTAYLDLINVRVRESSTDRDLNRLSAQEYASLPNKTSAGTPNSYFVRKTRSTIELSLWPVPSTASTIVADGVRVIEDVTALTETLDIPQEWHECVFYGLADRLSVPFGVHRADPILASEVSKRASGLFALMKSFDEETGSIFLSPDYRG